MLYDTWMKRPESKKRTDRGLILCIVVGSLLTSIPYALWLNEAPFSDMKSYELIATSLLTGGDYVYLEHWRAYRTPGLTFYLAGIYGIAGLNNYFVVRLVQCAMLAVLNVILFRTGKSIFGRRIAVWGVILTIFSQEVIFWAAKPATEFLYTFLLVLYVWILTNWSLRSGWRRLMLAAFVLGLATLTRPVAGSIAALTVIVMAFLPLQRPWVSRLTTSALFLVVFSLTLSPWLVRNWLLFDRVILNTNSGHTLYMANESLAPPGRDYDTVWQEQYDRILGSPEPRAQPLEIEMNDFMSHAARGYILDHPGRFLALGVKRLKKMLTERKVYLTQVPWETLSYFGRVDIKLIRWHPALALVAGFGLVLALLRRPGAHWMILCVIVGTLAVHFAYTAAPRMRVPLRPFLNMYICYGIGVAAVWVRSRSKGIRKAFHAPDDCDSP